MKKVSRKKVSRTKKVRKVKRQPKALKRPAIPKVKVKANPLEPFRTYGKGGWTYHLPDGTPTTKKELKAFLAGYSK